MTRIGAVVEFIGIGNGRGQISFNKTVTIVNLWLFVRLSLREPSFTVQLLSYGFILIAAGFGLKGFLAAVKRYSFGFGAQNDTSRTVIDHTITDRRDTERGIEPSP